MRKPRRKWGYGKNCAGRPTRWLCKWQRFEETCGECGHHQGWGAWYDGAEFVARYHHDYKRGACVRCGEKEPPNPFKGGKLDSTFHIRLANHPWPSGANVLLTGLSDPLLAGDD